MMDARQHNRILTRVTRADVVAIDVPTTVARLRVFEPSARPKDVIRALIDAYEMCVVDDRLALKGSIGAEGHSAAEAALQEILSMRVIFAAMAWATVQLMPTGYGGGLMRRFDLSTDELLKAIEVGDGIQEAIL